MAKTTHFHFVFSLKKAKKMIAGKKDVMGCEIMTSDASQAESGNMTRIQEHFESTLTCLINSKFESKPTPTTAARKIGFSNFTRGNDERNKQHIKDSDTFTTKKGD